MVFSSLVFEKKNRCYGLLDYADLVFKNLYKHRANEYGIPLTPSGELDVVKFYQTKTEEFKKAIIKSKEALEEYVILEKAKTQAEDFLNNIWNKFSEEDYHDLLEPVNTKYLNFLSESQFAAITSPRKITRQIDGKIEKIDWFLTGDQERLLHKYLVEEER